jgi:hypothetical protein
MASTMSKTDLVAKANALVANRNDWHCNRISYYTFKDRSDDLWLGIDEPTKKRIQREIACIDAASRNACATGTTKGA